MIHTPQRFRVATLAILAGLVWFGATEGGRAQEVAPEAAQSKEDKIRQHRERIRAIIQERRDQQKTTEEKPATGVPAAPDQPPAQAPGTSPQEPGKEKSEPPSVNEGEPVPPSLPGQPSPPGAPPDQQPPGEGGPSASTLKVANCLLYIRPSDTIATVGARFVTRVMLDNPSRMPVERVSVLLRYDPRVMSCLRVFDDQIRPYLVAPAWFDDRTGEGIIEYEAQLKTPRMLPKPTVLTILWEALRPTQYSQLQFEFDDKGFSTAVTLKDQGILGISTDPYDGVINASVLIRKSNPNPQTDLMSVKRSQVLDFSSASEVPSGAVGLLLGPPRKRIRVGETFEVPIGIRNPDALPIDMLALHIRFNPQVLEVVDWDKGNWIRRGINIHDGDRHALYPFDYLISNEALNALGTIEYRMGLQQPRALLTGHLATIRFLAKAPSADTMVSFAFSEEHSKDLTAVSVHGVSLKLDPALSLPSLTFKVFP